MPLSAALLDRVFERCMVRYGSQWFRAWDGIGEEAVRADWAKELEPFENHPKVLGYAIVNLPIDYPPNAAQFRELCRRAPDDLWNRPPALPDPGRSSPARYAAELSKLKQLVRAPSVDWAYALEKREKTGEILTPAQRVAWREALTKPSVARHTNGEFSPIDEDKLPRGMRTERLEDGRPVPAL